jgi:hypothetical protein
MCLTLYVSLDHLLRGNDLTVTSYCDHTNEEVTAKLAKLTALHDSSHLALKAPA